MPSTTDFLLNYLNRLSRIIHRVETVWQQPNSYFRSNTTATHREITRDLTRDSRMAQFHEPISRLLIRVGEKSAQFHEPLISRLLIREKSAGFFGTLPFETDFRNFSSIFRTFFGHFSVHPQVSCRLTRLPTCARAEVVKVFVKSNYRPTYFSFVLSVVLGNARRFLRDKELSGSRDEGRRKARNCFFAKF